LIASCSLNYRVYIGKGEMEMGPFHALSWPAVRGSFDIYQEEFLQTIFILQKSSLLS
jgi:hypothetical protein